MALQLHITSVPAGEAPLWVREKWVGLTLPLLPQKEAPSRFMTSGVLTGPTGFIERTYAWLTGRLKPQTGYAVDAQIAIGILASRSPEAAAWWRDHAPHLIRFKRYFVFQQSDGHLEQGPG